MVDTVHCMHTMRYFVLGFSRFPEVPEDSIRVDVDGHAGQEENVTNEKARVIKPAHIVVEVVCEVAPLHVTIDKREEERKKSRGKGSRLPTHTQRKEENPITKINYHLGKKFSIKFSSSPVEVVQYKHA